MTSFILISLILLPKISLFDFSIIPLVIYSLYLAITKRKILMSKFIGNILIVWIMIFLFAIIALIYHGQVANEIIFKPLRQIIMIGCLSYILYNKKYSLDDIFKAILIASVINSVIVIVQYILDLTGISDNFLMIGGFNEEIIVPWRKPGLFSGYPPAGMIALIGVIISFYFIRYKYTLKNVLFLIISILALLLTSRLAMLIGVVYILILIPLTIIAGRRQFILFFTLPIILTISIYYLINENIIHHNTFNVMFEVFINYSNSGDIESKSGSALIESYYDSSPKYISTLLIGNGNTLKSDYGLSIDSGIQIVLFNAGMIVLILYYFLFFYFFINSIKLLKNKREYIFYVFLIFLSVFVANFKGSFLFARTLSDVLLIVVLSINMLYLKELKNQNIEKD